MKLMKKIQGAVHTCLLPLCVASFVFGTTAHAQDVRERVIKFSHVQPKIATWMRVRRSLLTSSLKRATRKSPFVSIPVVR